MATSGITACDNTTAVRVAVRVRPMSANEHQQQQNQCIDFIPGTNQLTLANKHSFTFDNVFAPSTDQHTLYETSILPLVHKFLEGYNATVLAYGQTGSGKTYSMGIGLDAQHPDEQGILQRFVKTLFDHLQQHKNDIDKSEIRVSFLELHNEDLVDLLVSSSQTLKKENQPMVVIREDTNGNICWSGVREETVHHPHQLYSLLERGSIARTTAATDMNISSSRSHAIFSIRLDQTKHTNDQPITLSSKFHFVDLAGSERLKRTNAVGNRAKEGISINSGLLALGNVISALGDPTRRSSHVPYRDAKLTRLLQDSLGGNSQTLMLACVSPAWSNHKESLNTLQYANRARNIRNRVTVNEQSDVDNAASKQQQKLILRLKQELSRLRQDAAVNDDFLIAVNHEMDGLKTQVECLNQTIASLVQELAHTKAAAAAAATQHLHPDLASALTPTASAHSLITPPASPIPATIALQDHLAVIEQQKAHILTLQLQVTSLKKQQELAPPARPVHQPTPPPSPLSSAHMRPAYDGTMARKDSSKIKRHSYRFGSKRLLHRSISLRRRPTGAVHRPPANTQRTGDQPAACWKGKMKSYETHLEQDLDFLHQVKSNIMGHPESLDIQDNFNDVIAFSSTLTQPPPTLEISAPKNNVQSSSSVSLHHQVPQHVWTDVMARFSLCLERHRDLLDTVIMVYQQQDRDGRQPAGGSHQQQQQYKQLQQQLQQLRRAMDECKRQYDMQAKKQQHEHLALKRQYQQMVLAQERSRTQHNAIVMTLKQKLDGLIKEKKKMTKRAKQDTDRHRERERQLAKQILQLERKMAKHEQAKLRLDHDLQHQRASCKRSKEDTIAVATQLQTIAWVMTTIVDANRSSLSIAHRNLLAKAIAGARARSHLIPVKKQISTSVKKSKKRASFQRSLEGMPFEQHLSIQPIK